MNGPDAIELLNTARDMLLKQLLPALPQALHYECRMVASAMAMAGREIERGARAGQVEDRALAEVLGLQGLAGLTAEDARALLGQFVRQGIFDQPGKGRDALLQALAEITRARLSISNPKVVNDER
ncbi:hypothetical protein D3C85_831140 [compost metagenome]